MVDLIMKDMLHVFQKYTTVACITGAIVVVVICIIQSIISKESIGRTIICNGIRFVLIYVFCIYLFLVLSITYLSRVPGSMSGVNLKLFSTLTPNIHYIKVYLENIILFIPFGFLLPFLWDKFFKFINCVGVGLLLIIGIELGQYLTQRGYFQTDDIFTNAIGIMIGYAFVYGCRMVLRGIRDIRAYD